MEENPEERAIWDEGQGLKAAGFAEAVIEAYDFADFGSICDVGGGNGTFLTTLLVNYPHINGFVADLPKAMISAEGGRTIGGPPSVGSSVTFPPGRRSGAWGGGRGGSGRGSSDQCRGPV